MMTKTDRNNRFTAKDIRRLLLAACLVLTLVLSAPAAFAAADDDADQAFAMARAYLRGFALSAPTDQVLAAKSIDDMMSLYKQQDRWAAYYSPDTFKNYSDSTQGSMVGIGIYYELHEQGAVVVGTVGGSPAAASDLKSGDIITQVNGHALAGLKMEDIAALLKGDEGDAVELTVLKQGVARSYVFVLKQISLDTVRRQMLEGNVGYLAISQFGSATANQLNEALSDLKSAGATSLVVDLRGCPGGMVSSLADCLGAFIGKHPAFFVETRDGSVSCKLADNWPPLDLPFAVLINQSTASAAEVMAAAVQDTGAGAVVGVTSYGKGVMQNVYSLPDGSGVVFTVAKIRSTYFRDLDALKGVTPDIYVEDADAQLTAAIAWLKTNQLAASKLTYYLDGKGALFDGRASDGPFAVSVSGVSYLPLWSAAAAMGYQVTAFDGKLILKAESGDIAVDPTSGVYYKKGLSYQARLIKVKDTWYIASRDLASLALWQVSWDSGKNAVVLTAPGK